MTKRKMQAREARGLVGLLSREALFCDPSRSASDNDGPHVIVVDDFYEEPLKVRELALGLPYVQYAPPLEKMVDAEVFAASRMREVNGRWMSSVLETYHGRPVRHPFAGHRHNPESLRLRMEAITGDHVAVADWEPGGDGWNGAFHLRDAEHVSGAIHHHHYASNIPERGWSGVVYLSPDAPPDSGTSFWRDRRTGRCVAGLGQTFDYDFERFEKMYLAQNRFNRLVLFRENVLHFAEPGFGQGDDRRLTQTFFFRSSRP